MQSSPRNSVSLSVALPSASRLHSSHTPCAKSPVCSSQGPSSMLAPSLSRTYKQHRCVATFSAAHRNVSKVSLNAVHPSLLPPPFRFDGVSTDTVTFQPTSHDPHLGCSTSEPSDCHLLSRSWVPERDLTQSHRCPRRLPPCYSSSRWLQAVVDPVVDHRSSGLCTGRTETPSSTHLRVAARPHCSMINAICFVHYLTYKTVL